MIEPYCHQQDEFITDVWIELAFANNSRGAAPTHVTTCIVDAKLDLYNL
jgi:hypothetical protein